VEDQHQVASAGRMIISELSAKTGVSARSLRYYEEQGLVTPVRTANGYRHYSDDAVGIVKTIRSMYEVGFPTSTVREVLPCATGDHSVVDADAVRSKVTEMRASIAERIAELEQTRDALDAFLEGRIRVADGEAVAV
jgi:DNA-binding transcriptional MerR regulator